MAKYMLFLLTAAAFLSAGLFSDSHADLPLETVAVEGIVEEADPSSLTVSGKRLIAGAYSSVNSAGTGISEGDYVAGFAVMNEDGETYTILSLSKIPERSQTLTETPPEEETRQELTLLSDPGITDIFASPPAVLPDETVSSAFEGRVEETGEGTLVIGGERYYADSGTDDIPAGSYVTGRVLGTPEGRRIVQMRTVPEYECPDSEVLTVFGVYRSQSAEKLTVSLNGGEREFLFSPACQMSAPFYSPGTVLRLDVKGGYAADIRECPQPEYQRGISAVGGTAEGTVDPGSGGFILIADGTAYAADAGTRIIPDRKSFVPGTFFSGIMEDGRLILLSLSASGRPRPFSGEVSALTREEDGTIRFTAGGKERLLTADTLVNGSSLRRFSTVSGYEDGEGRVLYLYFRTPRYARIREADLRILIPTVISVTALALFLLLHRTETEGTLEDVDGDLLTLADGRSRRHYRCTSEVSRYVSSLVTMKVRLVICRGKVIHVRYDF